MEPEEIFPEVTDKVPHNLRNSLREVVEKYEINEELSREDVLFFDNGKVKIKVESWKMDLDKGEEIAELNIETPEFQLLMTARNAFVSDVMIKFYGYHSDEEFHFFPETE